MAFREDLVVRGVLKVGENIETTGNIIGKVGGVKTSRISAETAAVITVTASANTDLVVGTQPANTRIKNIYLKVDADTATAGTSGDNLNLSLGTAAGGTQIMAAKALLKDGGGAVTFIDNNIVPIVSNFVPAASNGLATAGIATHDAFTLATADAGHTTAERTIHARFTPVQANLASSGKATVIVEFEHD
tara:strand:+ start:679 stop:1248 length:570 start_codon:yes stop_codon:yes gene_type:complete